MPGAFLLDRTIEPPWPSEQVRNAVECDTRWGCLVGREHGGRRSEEHTSELQSLRHLVCRLLLEKKKKRRGPAIAGGGGAGAGRDSANRLGGHSTGGGGAAGEPREVPGNHLQITWNIAPARTRSD